MLISECIFVAILCKESRFVEDYMEGTERSNTSLLRNLRPTGQLEEIRHVSWCLSKLNNLFSIRDKNNVICSSFGYLVWKAHVLHSHNF